jgi:GxxExxY protein
MEKMGNIFAPTDRNNLMDIKMEKEKKYIYEDLTHILIGYFFNIHNSLGVGYDERAYHNALERCFQKMGVPYRSKERKTINHRNLKIREFEADFIVFDKIILELKAVQSQFLQAHYVQIISELKLWQLRLGLLVNFGLQKVEIERMPFSEKAKEVNENYDYIKNYLTDADRTILAKLRDAILYVLEVHGLGFGQSIYQKIMSIEIDYRQIKYQNRFPIKVKYDEEIISLFKMKPLLIENRLICDIKALVDEIDFYDIARIQSYLRSLGLKIGIIVNFGRKGLEIRGIRA